MNALQPDESIFVYKNIIMNNWITYLGPQDHWLSKYIPKAPMLSPNLKAAWNKAAFMHDVDYSTTTGEKKKGFFGWIKNGLDRLQADEQFYSLLIEAIEEAVENNEISSILQYDEAIWYAKKCYQAVRAGGALFYKKNPMQDHLLYYEK